MSDAGRNQVTRIAAYALCEDDVSCLLLCRLSIDEAEPGAWTLPGGGLDFGEDPVQAVLRELTEETGLSGEVVSLAGIDSKVWWDHVRVDEADDFHAIRILYRVNVTGGTLRDEVGGSTDAAAWYSRAEIAALPIVDLVRTGLRLLDER